jgi:hypothetical protein
MLEVYWPWVVLAYGAKLYRRKRLEQLIVTGEV